MSPLFGMKKSIVFMAWTTFSHGFRTHLWQENNNVLQKAPFFIQCTLPETNIAPENGWLEY